MQEALLVVGFEHDVLRVVIQQRRLVVELHRGFAVAGLGFGLRQPLDAARRQPHVLADHVVAAHGARKTAAPVRLEVEDLAGLLDEPVENPLLVVALQVRPADFRVLGAGHNCYLSIVML